MQFTTLLPPAAAHQNGGRRSPLLIDADDPKDAEFQVAASVLATGPDEERILQVRAWSLGLWAVFGLDACGILRCSAWGGSRREAEARWEVLMELFGLTPLIGHSPLLPPKETHGGPRRSSLLIDDDDPDAAAAQVSAKRIVTSAEARLLQIRVWIHGAGWTQLVLDDGLSIAAFTAADSEKASWKAAQAALRARDFDV